MNKKLEYIDYDRTGTVRKLHDALKAQVKEAEAGSFYIGAKDGELHSAGRFGIGNYEDTLFTVASNILQDYHSACAFLEHIDDPIFLDKLKNLVRSKI